MRAARTLVTGIEADALLLRFSFYFLITPVSIDISAIPIIFLEHTLYITFDEYDDYYWVMIVTCFSHRTYCSISHRLALATMITPEIYAAVSL